MEEKRMINWKVRIRNKVFWLTLIPAVLLLAQSIAAAAGVQLDLSDVQAKILLIVENLFALLAILGIVNDPTTAGIGDSEQALSYIDPKE
jgi:phi LC3 family holin